MITIFQRFANAKTAANFGCFQCLQPLNHEKIQDDGFADGRGRYSIKCDKCQMSTWFDLWNESGNPIKQESMK